MSTLQSTSAIVAAVERNVELGKAALIKSASATSEVGYFVTMPQNVLTQNPIRTTVVVVAINVAKTRLALKVNVFAKLEAVYFANQDALTRILIIITVGVVELLVTRIKLAPGGNAFVAVISSYVMEFAPISKLTATTVENVEMLFWKVPVASMGKSPVPKVMVIAPPPGLKMHVSLFQPITRTVVNVILPALQLPLAPEASVFA